MKILIAVLIEIIMLGCSPPKKLTQQIYANRVINLDIGIVINKNDYSYQFKFLNKSADTIEIIKPEISHAYSYFSKIKADGVISSDRCATFTLNQIEWIELPPQKEIILNGRFSLKDFFCEFNDNDLIAFVYSGGFRRKDKATKIFCFEINPTTISKIDSMFISKVLF